MGILDKISEKANAVAQNAKKAAGQALDDASKTAKELSDKASAGFSSLTENVGTSAKELSAWAETMPDKLRKMADDFDVNSLWDKLSKTAAKAGQELIVMVLTIYYAVESKIPDKQNSENNVK